MPRAVSSVSRFRFGISSQLATTYRARPLIFETLLYRSPYTGQTPSFRTLPMRFSRLATLLAVPAQVAFGQQTAIRPQTGSLTLDAAIQLARENNPAYRRAENSLC